MKLAWVFIGIPFVIYVVILLNNLKNFRSMSTTANLDCDTILEKREINEDFRLCESVQLVPASMRRLILSTLVFAVLIRFTRKSVKH